MTRKGKLGNAPGADDHLTPLEILERVRRVARIDLDPCGNPDALIVTREHDATDFWGGEHTDGLAQDWSLYVKPGYDSHAGLFYANPPFSDIHPWVKKALETARQGHTGIVLVPCRTSQPYWATLCENAAAIAFWEGTADYIKRGQPGYLPRRVRFLRPDGTRQAGAPFDTALFLLTQRPTHLVRFVRAFGDVATIVRPATAPLEE